MPPTKGNTFSMCLFATWYKITRTGNVSKLRSFSCSTHFSSTCVRRPLHGLYELTLQHAASNLLGFVYIYRFFSLLCVSLGLKIKVVFNYFVQTS